MDRVVEWHEWVIGGRKGPAPSLSGIDRRHANLYGVNLRGADLRDANLRYANLYGVNLRDADLSIADLAGAKLCYAGLRSAALRYANLQGADLLRADLRGADLYGAHLWHANLRGANLDGMLNARELITDDPRGYRLVVVRHGNGWRVFAGCRYFKIISEAIDHWSHPDHPNRGRGQRYVQALTNFAKEM